MVVGDFARQAGGAGEVQDQVRACRSRCWRDEEKAAAQAYGVWKEKNMYGKKVMGIERTTFVIGERGKIEKIYAKVKRPGTPRKCWGCFSIAGRSFRHPLENSAR